MKFITSLNPNNIEKCQNCVQSWLSYLDEVVAVQGPGEVEVLQPKFPNVTFVTTDQVGEAFDAKFCPRIHTLTAQGPGIIINSDIHMIGDRNIFVQNFLTPRDKVLEVGIRWDYEHNYDNRKLNPYGIDVFKITEELMEIYKEDTPFSIGQPGWDYYYILHARDHGFYINSHRLTPMFMHELHPANWSQWKLTLAQSMLERLYKVPSPSITNEVRRLTKRTGSRSRLRMKK